MHTTNCNWTRIENFMQIHPRQARSGYELIRGGMCLTVALIRYMSVSLQNLFRWLNLGFEQQSPLTHSLTQGITHTAYALCSAVIDFVKHECVVIVLSQHPILAGITKVVTGRFTISKYTAVWKSQGCKTTDLFYHTVPAMWAPDEKVQEPLRESAPKSKNTIIFIILI